MTTESHAPGPSIDRETVCFTTTAEPEVHHGSIRHDDTLTGQPGTEFGWALFDQNQTPVPATEPGLEFVDCTACCDEVLGDGCWDDGTTTGTWVSVRDPDGTVTLTDPATGVTVDPADIVDCTPTTYRTEVRTVDGGTTFTIPGAGSNLVSWSVRARVGQPELNVSGVTTVMDEGEIIESAAQRDDGAVLEDVPVVTAGAGESARVVYLLRTEA